MTAYLMVRFDSDLVKEKVIACYTAHKFGEHVRCREILLNRINEEIDIIKTQDVSLADITLAGIIYYLPDLIGARLQKRFYKTDDMVSILKISLIRFNLHKQFLAIKQCFESPLEITREHIYSCAKDLQKRYEKVVEEVIKDYKF